jgi:hypothetical protein
MAQAPLNPTGGRARLISGKIPSEDAQWLDALVEQSGTTTSALLRRLIAVGRKHKEELLEAS